MKIKDIPVLERPIERAIIEGVDKLSNEELLAIILKTGTNKVSCKDLALNIIKSVGNINNLNNVSFESLIKINGIGNVKAISILASLELSKRVFYTNSNKKIRYIKPSQIYEDFKYLFMNIKQEYFYTLYFNNKQELIGRKLLFMGTVNKSVVHPREVFKEAYLLSASSIVCMHNHPSNDVNPSRADDRLTKALVSIGEMNGIPIIDHIIVGKDDFYSYQEHNKIGFIHE